VGRIAGHTRNHFDLEQLSKRKSTLKYWCAQNMSANPAALQNQCPIYIYIYIYIYLDHLTNFLKKKRINGTTRITQILPLFRDCLLKFKWSIRMIFQIKICCGQLLTRSICCFRELFAVSDHFPVIFQDDEEVTVWSYASFLVVLWVWDHIMMENNTKQREIGVTVCVQGGGVWI